MRLLILLLASLIIQIAADAATLKPETVTAWESYVQEAHSRMQERLLPGRPFLLIDEKAPMADKVRSGKLLVLPVGQTPQKAAGGLIHDWVGTVFIPNANFEAVLSTIRDYHNYKEFYYPAVVDSKPLNDDGSSDRFFLLLTSKTLGLKAAFQSEYTSTYFKVDGHRWYSISETTRMQEVRNYGTPEQQILSENEGTGLIWKMMSMTCFEQRDDGVYIELEVIALSRDIPQSLRWIVSSIVRRLSKDSLLTTLQQTREAVRSRGATAIHDVADAHGKFTVRTNTASTANSFR